MKKFYGIILLVLVSFSGFSKKREAKSTIYQFVENQGQFHPNVLYRTDLPNGFLYLERNALTYHFYDTDLRRQLHDGDFIGSTDNLAMRFHAYKATFVGANPVPKVKATEKYRNYYNFFLGNDPKKWAGNVPAFGKLDYQNMYPGIDFIMYSDEEKGLKYDLILEAGANPNQIAIQYEGVDSLYIHNGKLHVITSLNENWEEKPDAYQIIDGKRVKVKCKYVLKGQTLSYDFPNGYDESAALIIDPTLVFSSYTGSTANNFGYTATYDKFGYLYSGSSAFNTGYPTTFGAYQVAFAGGTGNQGGGLTGTDMAITKWDTTGTFLIFSTYLGGSSDELPHSLVVTDFNELYIMGTTGSSNFPVTTGAFDTVFNINPSGAIPVNLLSGLAAYYLNGSDIVIAKLNSSGSNLDASTFLGGTHTDGINDGANKFNYADEIRGEIDLDQNGKVYVATCTRSTDNPVDTVGFQITKPNANNNIDGIIYKLNHNLTGLEWTNYVGDADADAAYSIAIASDNSTYITGGTRSTNFPTTTGAFDVTYNGANDGFVMHISEDGSTMLQSTFYGSNAYDQSYFVELDNAGDVFLFGQTSAPTGNLISNATYNEPLGGQFIVKFNPTISSTIWATRFGSGDGTPDISPTAFLVDLCSAVYLSGWGSPIQGGSLTTTGLDISSNPIQGTTDGHDFYVMVMADDASSLTYATFFGGSAYEHVDGGTSRFDRKGKIYQAVCAGCGGSNDFPTTANAVSSVNGTSNGCNLAVFKMDFNLPIVVADFTMPTTGCAPFLTPFNNLSLTQSATTFFWDFGDGTSSTQFQPSHVYPAPGVYIVTLYVNDTATCNLGDSITKTITILSNTNTTLPPAVICDGSTGVQIGIPQNNDPNLTYTWFPNTYLSDTSVTNPIATPPVNTTYYLLISNGICTDTIIQDVVYDISTISLIGDSAVCSINAPFMITVNTNGLFTSFHWSNFPDFSDTINTNPTDTVVFVQAPDSVNWYYITAISALGCEIIDSFKIIVLDNQNPLTASFTDPGPGCAPYNVTFINTTSGTPQTTYNWSFGNGGNSNAINPNTTYLSSGMYPVTLIVTDSTICPQIDTLTIWVQTREDSSYTVNQIACAGQVTTIGIPADTIPGTTYTWTPTTGLSNPAINNPTVNTSSNLSYLLIVQHVCVDSVTVNVTAEPISAISPDQIVLCSDNPIVTLSGNSFGTGQNFVWSTQPNYSDTLNTQLWDSTAVINQTAGIVTYYFRVESANGCIEDDTTVVVISDLTIDVTPDKYICQGDTISLTATNNFTGNPMDFFWSPASEIIGAIDVETITVAPLINTTYYVTAVNDSGCVFKDSVLVEVSLLNEAMVIVTVDLDSLLEGTSTMVHAQPEPGYVYSWEPAQYVADPTAANTLASPEKTTIFTCTVSDPRNASCSYKKGVEIEVYEIHCGEPEIFIPNAFTPNYDGEHDKYRVEGQVIEKLELKIYNRWGQLVFETTDKEEYWDGKFKGELVDPEVFVYHLQVTCVDGQEFLKKGNITVIR